jgi:hypothetical protein
MMAKSNTGLARPMEEEAHSNAVAALRALGVVALPILGMLLGGALANIVGGSSQDGQLIIFGGLLGLAVASLAVVLVVLLARRP